MKNFTFKVILLPYIIIGLITLSRCNDSTDVLPPGHPFYNTETQILTGYSGPLSTTNEISFSPNADYFFLRTYDHVKIFRHVSGQFEESQEFDLRDIGQVPGIIKGACFSPKGNYLVGIIRADAGLLSIQNRVVFLKKNGDSYKEGQVFRMDSRYNKIKNVVFSPNEMHLGVLCTDQILILKNKNGDFKEILSLEQEQSIVNAISFSPDDEYLACGTSDFKVKIWKIQYDQYDYHQQIDGFSTGVRLLAFNNNWTWLAAQSTDEIRIFQRNQGKFVIFQLITESVGAWSSKKISEIFLSPDGTVLVTKSERELKVYRNNGYEFVQLQSISARFVGLVRDPENLAFSPEWNLMAIGNSKKIRLFQLSQNGFVEIETLQGDLGSDFVTFSDNNRFLASGDTRKIQIWSRN